MAKEEAKVPETTDPEETTSVPAAAESPPAEEPAASEEWSVRYKYLLAEFDNFRKRVEREREVVRREARALVLRELLALYESFERAQVASRQLGPDHPLRRGLELIRKEWEAFLLNHKVEALARPGEPFRPEDHEAVGERTPDAKHPEGSVAEVVQQGYRSSEGILRHAKVLVARTPMTDEPSGSVTSPP